jgi:hypothetical protein
LLFGDLDLANHSRRGVRGALSTAVRPLIVELDIASVDVPILSLRGVETSGVRLRGKRIAEILLLRCCHRVGLLGRVSPILRVA